MSKRGVGLLLLGTFTLCCSAFVRPQNIPGNSSSSSKQPQKPPRSAIVPELESGTITNSVYRNPTLGFSCKIPAGWVLRTDELNTHDEDGTAAFSGKDSKAEPGQVLLAAFSRPPQARAEDVNSSILIAAESAAAYPGLKDAAQYFGPLNEVTKAEGFAAVGDPYEFSVGAKTLPREDFQKDVGTRVMRQSTLVILARGYVVSFTFIGGTEDEVEELIGGLSFMPSPKITK
jgi:hypothetical protein